MFTRSQFLSGLVGAVVLPPAREGARESEKAPCVYRKASLSVGAEKPFSVLHISDTHLVVLTEAEKAASEWRGKYYARRHDGKFRNAERHLADAIAYASERRMPLVHTGDLMDCPSDGNVEIVRRMVPPGSILAAVGNHETCSRYFRGLSEKPEDLSRERSLSASRIASCWPNDGKFFAKVVSGVNFVMFDDSDYQIRAEVREGLECEFAVGLPVVLGCHIPICTPELLASPIRMGKNPAMVCAPNAKGQERPTADTVDAVEWLKSRPNLKAVLAGHLHAFWRGEIAPGVMQLVAGGHFKGSGYEILFS